MNSSLKREIPALPPAAQDDGHRGTDRRFLLLSLSALGVVYGDIGTSPIYALRECFHGSHPFPPTETNVLGVLSLIFWALMIIISLKYLLFVMRADNHGEGGILALLALLAPWRDGSRKSRVLLFSGCSARRSSMAMGPLPRQYRSSPPSKGWRSRLRG